ncbi:P-loop containing nucleoside triphosphate hydrolase protein [Mariannaea sp. PMI_226]|nr:P-loop containing nucleoside triphosphate hydrolase protein [Mariannaea sp. PMI_226]
MRHLRQLPLQTAKALSRSLHGRSNASFSTSTALGPRMRPGARNPTSESPHVETQKDGQGPKYPLLSKSTKTPDSSSLSTKPTPPPPPPAQPLEQVLPQKKTPSKPPKRVKGVTIRGLKPYQQSLYQHESILYQQGVDGPVEITKNDKPPLATAARFFEESCRLLYSAETLKHHPQNDHIPEIVVLGASNAGKSSFLNALVGNMDVARVSHRPGKTTTMNAYGIGPRPKIAKELIRKGDMPPKHSLVFMDTPGYGFKSQQDWGKTILTYLKMRKMLRGAVLLLPTDKKLQDTDRWMLQTLARSKTRTLVVLTKADKAGDNWPVACKTLATAVQEEMLDMKTSAASRWREGTNRAVDVYATAADMGISAKLGNGGGLGGVRLAILEMAGFALGERVEQQLETKSYTGTIVSFDELYGTDDEAQEKT